MRFRSRLPLLALTVGAIVGISAPAANAAFGVSAFQALSCKENAPEGEPGECNAGTPSQFFTQAGGHPNFGITDFTFNESGTAGDGVKTIRTDLPVGFSTNPQALPLCSLQDFEANTGKFADPSHCPPSSEAGIQEITVTLPGPTSVTLTGKVFNLEPAFGLPLEFGIDIPILGFHLHSLLEGGVSWHKEAEATEEGIASGDYHEYFKLKIPKSISEGEIPIARSRLVFNGKAGAGLNTTPTTCPGPQTTHLRVEPYAGSPVTAAFTTTPTAAEENCKVLTFEPGFSLVPSSTRSDAPVGITAELSFPINKSSSEIEGSDLRTTEATLPAGMTINPAAAAGLEACTPEEFGIGTEATSVSCPSRSAIGTAVLSVPGLPPESLKGKIFLGDPSAGPITGPPYKVFIAVESARYGQLVRLEGSAQPDLTTGQLTVTFADQPQGPFRSIRLAFTSGLFANLGNPIDCGRALTASTFSPYSGNPPVALVNEFAVDSNGSGAPCPPAPAFSPVQHTASEPGQAGASGNFTLNLERPEGQQYLSAIKTVLPPGLVALIPTVPRCGEPQADLGTCAAASQIGTITVAAGSGEPFAFHGKVYLTGPYEGAPFGLSMVVPPVSGPFVLPNVIARATIDVKSDTGQVIVSDPNVPRIVAGIPIRVRALTISVNRPGLRAQPDQLRRTRHAVDLDRLYAGRGERGCHALHTLPGRRLQHARLPAELLGEHRGETEQTEWRKPRNDDQPALRAGEHQVGGHLAAQAAPLAPHHAPESMSRKDLRGEPVQLSGGLAGRGRAGEHPHPPLETDRTGLPRLARRSGLPRSRPRARSRWRAGDPQRRHRNQERNHDDAIRRGARRPRLEHHHQPADGSALGARRLRQPLHHAAQHAYDDHGAERQAGQADHEDRRQGVRCSDRRQEGVRRDCLSQGEDVRSGPDQRQRLQPVHRRATSRRAPRARRA